MFSLAGTVPVAGSCVSASIRFSYENDLWGGLELAERRVEEGRKTYREVQSFMEEMISLELAYVKGFKKLSARQSQCSEGGTLGSAWQAFRKYLHINADMHALLMEHWKKAAFALQDHCAQQTKMTTVYFGDAAKLTKEHEKGYAEILRLKGRYYKLARDAESAKQQYEGAQNDSSIPTTKLVKLNSALQALTKEAEGAEKQYAKAVEDFNAFQEQYVQDVKKILHALEAMEESRIVTMKSILEEGCLTWGGSFTHQPEALGAVQKIIRNIDEQKDLQTWLMGNKTGIRLPEPVVMEPWQPASKFRRDRSTSGNAVRFKFKPEGVGTVIVSPTSDRLVPTRPKPIDSITRSESEASITSTTPPEGSQTSASPRLVEALHDYHAEEDDELTISAGDIITVLEVEDEGWWKGEVGGRVGLFPSNYVRPVEGQRNRASGDYTREHTAPLSPTKRSLSGSHLQTDPPSPILPSYTPLSTSSPSLLAFLQQEQAQASPDTKPSGSGGRRSGKLLRTGGQRRIFKGGEGEEAPQEDQAQLPLSPTNAPDPGAQTQTSSTSPHELPPSEQPAAEPEAAGYDCVVLFDFDAENEDEVSIRVGEIVRVTEQVEQWYVGVFPDGRAGMFPSNFVRRI